MDHRRPLIAGNWKMFKTGPEAVETADRLANLLSTPIDVDVMIAPPFTALAAVSNILKKTRISLGAQNLFWEAEGAYTGEISASMLVSAGCRYVIVGHSERRQYFGETDDTVNKKIMAAVKNNLIPVMCIGESEAERESQETFSVLDRQVQEGLKGYSADEMEKLVVA